MAIQHEVAYFVENLAALEKDNFGIYGYVNFIELRSGSMKTHIIIGNVIPSASATWDSAPISSLWLNTSGTTNTCIYIKEVSGTAGWAPINTTTAA